MIKLILYRGAPIFATKWIIEGSGFSRAYLPDGGSRLVDMLNLMQIEPCTQEENASAR